MPTSTLLSVSILDNTRTLPRWLHTRNDALSLAVGHRARHLSLTSQTCLCLRGWRLNVLGDEKEHDVELLEHRVHRRLDGCHIALPFVDSVARELQRQ